MNTALQSALDLHYAGWAHEQPAAPGDLSEVTAKDFRAAMGCLPTAVSVLTTRHPDGVWGMTVGSLTSLSMRPPLVLVCLHQQSTTLKLLATQGRFAVSVLAAGQHTIADAYAQPREHGTAPERFAMLDGLPIVPGAAAWLTCRWQDTHTSGDHTIVIGAVQHAEHRGGPPLIRHAAQYRALP